MVSNGNSFSAPLWVAGKPTESKIRGCLWRVCRLTEKTKLIHSVILSDTSYKLCVSFLPAGLNLQFLCIAFE